MWIFELLLLLYFGYVVAYTVTFALGGVFYKAPTGSESSKKSRFCVLIPSYKEDTVIIDSARRNLEQSYPHTHFDVVVIADSLKKETLDTLRNLPITVVPVSFENSTKVKALNKCLEQLSESYDYAVILDADNIMDPHFLELMNTMFNNHHFKVIQGQRKPKNNDNTLSYLDGLSEAINNHIYRQGTVALGMSASINGSGIAFDFNLLKQKLSTMNSVGGFDRELELLLLREGTKVYYYKNAIVYDEKVSQAQSFKNQRTRWIYSQYFYLRKYFAEGLKGLVRGDITFFNSSVLRNIQLPRLINLGLLSVITIVSFFIQSNLHFSATTWLFLWTANALGMLISIPKEFFTRDLLKAVVQLPLIFLQMITILFKLKGSNRKFIHTPHGLPDSAKENM